MAISSLTSPSNGGMLTRLGGGQARPSIDYSSYGSAVTGLREAQRGAQGYLGDTLSMAGSEAAGFAGQAGALEQQRTVDPWSFYRGEAADTLSRYTDPSADPSNVYRARLKQMLLGNFDSSDPSYEWRFNEGQRMSERSLAARGLLGSGNALIELQERGQGLASTEYDAQFRRLLGGLAGVEDQYNTQQQRLMALAGIGNVGAGIQQKQFEAGVAENANYQMGLASAMNQSKGGNNTAFGAGAI